MILFACQSCLVPLSVSAVVVVVVAYFVVAVAVSVDDVAFPPYMSEPRQSKRDARWVHVNDLYEGGSTKGTSPKQEWKETRKNERMKERMKDEKTKRRTMRR